MATAKSTEVVEIRPIDMKTVEVTLVGDTPMIMHAWSEKAKRMMLEAQIKSGTFLYPQFSMRKGRRKRTERNKTC